MSTVVFVTSKSSSCCVLHNITWFLKDILADMPHGGIFENDKMERLEHTIKLRFIHQVLKQLLSSFHTLTKFCA